VYKIAQFAANKSPCLGNGARQKYTVTVGVTKYSAASEVVFRDTDYKGWLPGNRI